MKKTTYFSYIKVITLFHHSPVNQLVHAVKPACTILMCLILFCIGFESGQLHAQCDVEVSGVLAYCNALRGSSNTFPGFFIGFRIQSNNGDTLNVIDLEGNVPMNLGKRIDNINSQQEPSDTSRAAIRIAGGIDSLEYWYFGPFMNGDSFNIVLVDPDGVCDTIEVASGTFTCEGQDPNACSADVPLYFLDFSLSEWTIGGGGSSNESFDAVFLIMQRSRVATCCHTTNDRCFEFIITLDEDDIGLLIDDVGSGSTAGNIYVDSLNGFACESTQSETWPWIQDNGQSGDEPICIQGTTREWIVLSCKEGNNVTGVSFGTVGTINVLPEYVYEDCTVTLEVLNADSAVWSSPDDLNLNNLINFTGDSTTATFSYDEGVFGPVTSCAGDTFTYYVGGLPDNECLDLDSLIFDTTYVIVFPGFDVSIDSTCLITNDSLLLEALFTSSALTCGYKFRWSTGDTTLSILVPNITGDYSITVTRDDIDSLVTDCSPAIDVIHIDPTSLSCPPNVSVSCIADVPPPDTTLVSVAGCGINPLVYSMDSDNNGTACGTDPRIISRYYIVDFDGDTVNTIADKDTCLQQFIFVDSMGPVVQCPSNLTLPCGSDTSVPSTGFAGAIDNCDPVLDLTYVDTIAPGTCPQEYTIYRTWRATDDCGNSGTCVQSITLLDTESPSIACPPDVTIAWNASTLPSNTGNSTSADNCDTSVLASYSDLLSPPCSQSNLITRTWIATDDCGNSSSCVQSILISDHGIICGTVLNELDIPLGNVQIQLIADVNANGIHDAGDTLMATTLTATVTGNYCFNDIKPCHYIVVEVQPLTYGDLYDYDVTPDPDGNDSLDGPDNQIPVALGQGENDNENNFVDLICPTGLPVIPPDSICENDSVVFEITPLSYPGTLTYSWDFGSGSMPGSATGLGPHTVSYVTTTGNQAGSAIITLTVSRTGCPDLVGEVSSVDINPYADATIGGSTAILCPYANRTFQPLAPVIPGAVYTWNFGSDAVPASANGYGPHTVYYTVTGTKTVSLSISTTIGADCPDTAFISFNVINCPGNITGFVRNTEGVGIQGVNVKLYADYDLNGIADNNTVIRNAFTTSSGSYAMVNLTPASYVIVESQPTQYASVDDEDISNDNDLVPNVDSLDNLIPCTINQAEIDAGNNFIETGLPGDVTGTVFMDENGDEAPDTGEGLDSITVKLHADTNEDGIADSGTPLASMLTDSSGNYSFADVPLGSYVLVEINPSGLESVKDFDSSNDLDDVPNTNINNDTLPLTITPNEFDQHNYFIDHIFCSLTVNNPDDGEPGSLRDILDCASAGDTIVLDSSLCGDTIWITSSNIQINHDLAIISDCDPRVTIYSTAQDLFEIAFEVEVYFKGFDMVSGTGGQAAAAIHNFGAVTLEDIHIYRNPLLPGNEFLIKNVTSSHLFLTGENILK